MSVRYVAKATHVIKRGPAWASSYAKGPSKIQLSPEVRQRRAVLVEESLKENSVIMGKVVKLTKLGLAENPVAKVRVHHNLLDEFFSMYWPEEKDFWSSVSSVEGRKPVRLGDDVIISPMKDPLNAHVKHQIVHVVYEHGRIVNPITCRLVWGDQHADFQEYKSQLTKRLLETAEDALRQGLTEDDQAMTSLLESTVQEVPLPNAGLTSSKAK